MNDTIQIWLLYASLNNALDNNKEILIPAFIASLILFLVGFTFCHQGILKKIIIYIKKGTR